MPPTRTSATNCVGLSNSVFQTILSTVADQVTFDHPHLFANISPPMLMAAECVIGFERPHIDSLDVQERECGICKEHYGDRPSHYPVRLPCKHTVGMPCILKWFDIFSYSAPQACRRTTYSRHRGTCPFCREMIVPVLSIQESFLEVTLRMQLWLRTYEILGVGLNRREADIRKTVTIFCLLCLEDFEDAQELRQLLTWQQVDALLNRLAHQVETFAEALRLQRLTRRQETKCQQIVGVAVDWLDGLLAGAGQPVDLHDPDTDARWVFTPNLPLPTCTYFPQLCYSPRLSAPVMKREDKTQ